MSKSGWRSRPIQIVGGAKNFVTRCSSIAAQDRARVGRRQDDAGRAEVDVDAEEAVELRAVVERQRVQLDVVGAHLPVDRRTRRTATAGCGC